MTDDIVTRLRAAAKDKDNMPRMKSETILTVGLGLEAAYEIERLEEIIIRHWNGDALILTGDLLEKAMKRRKQP